MIIRLDGPGHRWYPQGSRSQWEPPSVGDLIPRDHAAWRVVDVQPVPQDKWTDRDRKAVATVRPEFLPRAEPVMVVIRPVNITSDDVRARDRDKHLRHRDGVQWDVYPDEHYPVCARCREPLPCREKFAERIATDEMAKMSRYETAGVCPVCQETVTRRQKSLTFRDNLEVIGGPPVTFHLRDRCWGSAMEYEQRWVAADPERRKTTLSCAGHVTNHGDGTYDCTALNDCPGPQAYHGSYSVCSCPDCHARGQFNCHPSPTARRNGDKSDLFGDAA